MPAAHELRSAGNEKMSVAVVAALNAAVEGQLPTEKRSVKCAVKGQRGPLETRERGQRLTAGCLFSGMGGLASGLKQAGFSIRWACDNDEHASATFRHRFPDVRFIEKSVCDLDVIKDELGGVDVLAGGFPCQSFSQAGERSGFDDPRGALFFEIPRLLKEMDVNDRPRFLILENVPHLLYGAGGEWFDQIQRALRRAGYWFRQSACLIANVRDYTDLPQDRERLFMVAASKGHFAYNPFSPATVRQSHADGPLPLSAFIDRSAPAEKDAYLHKENRYYKLISKKMKSGESIENLYQLRRSYVREKKQGLCPTLTANMGVGGHNVPFVRDNWGIRRLRVVEVAGLQGFEMDDLLFPHAVPEKDRYRLVGNAACVHLTALVGSECGRILREAT